MPRKRNSFWDRFLKGAKSGAKESLKVFRGKSLPRAADDVFDQTTKLQQGGKRLRGRPRKKKTQ